MSDRQAIPVPLGANPRPHGAVAQRRNTSEERKFPSLDKEGWTRPQENVAKQPCWERPGWFVQTTDNRWLERTLDAARCRACAPRPSARAMVASRHFLDRAATPPYPRRGISALDDRCLISLLPA